MPRSRKMKELGIYQGKDEVQKNNHLIKCLNPLTAMQRKSFAYLLAETIEQIKQNGYSDFYQIELKKYQDFMKIDRRNMNYIRNSLIELLDKKLTWNTDKGGEIYSTIFTGFKVESGFMEWSLSPYLRNKILLPGFTIMKLSVLSQFTSTYAIALYEIISQWRNRGFIKMNLTEFRECMGIQENEYERMFDLKKYVLNIAINEINATSDLMVNCQDIKSVRKIVGFRFEFIKLNKQQLKIREDKEILTEKYLKDKRIKALFGMEYKIGNKWYKLTKNGLIYRKKVVYDLVDTIALFRQFEKDKTVIDKRRK